MSHYTLAVFTTDRPSQDAVSVLMSRYEETACNDDSKWDWWMIGGRWLGELIVKPGINDFIVGEPGVFGNDDQSRGVDGAQIGDLDLRAMLDRERDNRATHWDQAYSQQQKGAKPHPWTVDTSTVTKSEYVEQATPFTPFAYLLDGEWFEKGQMGWFAIVSDERTQADWDRQFAEVVEQQPRDHWITVLDCHI